MGEARALNRVEGWGVSVWVLCACAGLGAFLEREDARPGAGGVGKGARAELRAVAWGVRGGSRVAGQALAHINEWGGGGALRPTVHEWARNSKGEFALEFPWVSWAWKMSLRPGEPLERAAQETLAFALPQKTLLFVI